MSIKKYNQKRDFKVTTEPKAKKRTATKTKQPIFVVQKHASRHLHYDFRLEIHGVLKSWAVPKGPALDPNIKRLAVQVEDHPLDYATFEGTIPEGQYGAGKVKIWDKGVWENLNPGGYKKGDLSIRLHGKKMKGLWKLVQIKKDPKNWLLIKVEDKLPRLS